MSKMENVCFAPFPYHHLNISLKNSFFFLILCEMVTEFFFLWTAMVFRLYTILFKNVNSNAS